MQYPAVSTRVKPLRKTDFSKSYNILALSLLLSPRFHMCNRFLPSQPVGRRDFPHLSRSEVHPDELARSPQMEGATRPPVASGRTPFPTGRAPGGASEKEGHVTWHSTS